MDPGKDSIIYRLTQQKVKGEQWNDVILTCIFTLQTYVRIKRYYIEQMWFTTKLSSNNQDS